MMGRHPTQVLVIGGLLAAWLCSTASAQALKGVALAIGQSDYETISDLDNTQRDAKGVEDLLDRLGFETDAATDRDARQLRRDLEGFVEDAEKADVAVLYYAGHAVEIGGESFLVPVDIDTSSPESLAQGLVPLSATVEALRRTSKLVIVLLDACRDNPLPPGTTVRLQPGGEAEDVTIVGTGTRGIRLLSQQSDAASANLGMVIGFAAEPGKVALDGDAGGNSPYAAALLRHLSAMAGEEFGTVMRMIAREVYLKTDGKQRPWVNESLQQLLYFGEPASDPTGDEGDMLKERRQLLLTIDDLPDFRREQVERVASQGGVPMDAVYGMLRAMGSEIPEDPSKLEELLRLEAERFAKILAEREAINSPDPEIVRLTALADAAEREGLLAKADEMRERAKTRVRELRPTREAQREALDQRDAEDAAVFARSAETKSANFQHLAAAQDFAEAFQIVERSDETLALQYKRAEMVALTDHGNFRGDNAALERAIAAGMRALEFVSREAVPLDWAMTQNSLGNALQTLGERENATERLEQAVAAYRNALLERTRGRVPRDWAQTQNNIGNALLSLGERESRTERLEQAIDAYRAALLELTSERVPLQWATTQNNLGNALWTLGKRESGTARLEEAVAAYRSALQERTRERVPLDWAQTQNNIGTGLLTLGMRESGTERLEQAVDAYRAALLELTRERLPLLWATTQNNIGNALSTLGWRESDTARLEEAVAAYRFALQERTRERVPLDWAQTQNNLGNALLIIGERESGTARLEQAVDAYGASLLELTRERVPLQWATTQNNLGNALWTLGERESGTERLKQAVEAYRGALLERTRDRVPLDWAATKNNLGNALWTLGGRESGTERLERAVDAYRDALLERTRGRVPLDWAQTQNNLGNVLRTLGGRESGTERLVQAVDAYRAALQVYTRSAMLGSWLDVQYRMGFTLSALADRVDGHHFVSYLEEAIGAHREVQLLVRRDKQPAFWAELQNSIGYWLVLIGEREDNPARFDEAAPILREAMAVQKELGSASAHHTADSLCRALLNIGKPRRDRAVLLEARDLCESSHAVLSAAGDPATKEVRANLARVNAALSALE
jgi:uncharacterized caspase-like protein